MLLAIDPGVTTAGAALFDNRGTLVSAWLVQSAALLNTAKEIKKGLFERSEGMIGHLELAIEVPQIYVGSKQKGRQADLVNVSIVAGMTIGILSPSGRVEIYPPARWKGQTPKEVIEARVRERLSAKELATVETPLAKSKLHNIFDAVGIGLFFLKKL